MSKEFFQLPESVKRRIWADLLAVPVGMVSAGTVPAVGVPASRLALAVLHPGQFCRLPEGSDSPPNGSEKQV